MPDLAKVRDHFQTLLTLYGLREAPPSVYFDERGTDFFMALSRSEISSPSRNVSLKDFKDQLCRSVESAGGGLILVTTPANTSIEIDLVPMQGYDPPAGFYCLNTDMSTSRHEIPFSGRYTPGDHLLLATDQAEDQRLGELMDKLKSLGPDTERNVLQVIARPVLEVRMWNMDARLHRLEEQSKSRPQPEVATAQPNVLRLEAVAPKNPWRWNWKKWSWVGGITAAIVGLILLIPYLLRPAHPPMPMPSLAQSTALLDAMSKATGPSYTLYTTHELQGLRKSSDVSTIVRSRDFSTAALKLALFRYGLLEANSQQFNSPQLTTDSIDAFENQSKMPKEMVDLIQYFSCQAFGDPRLGERLELRNRCKDLPNDDAAVASRNAAIEDLTKWVQSPPTKRQPQPFETEVTSLLAAMKNSPYSVVRRLYESHKLGSLTTPVQDPAFAVAVVKLELLRMHFILESSWDFSSDAVATDTTRALSDPKNAAAIQTGKTTLLGYLLCRATKEAGIRDGEKVVRIPGITGCKEPDDKMSQRIADSLTALTDFVSKK